VKEPFVVDHTLYVAMLSSRNLQVLLACIFRYAVTRLAAWYLPSGSFARVGNDPAGIDLRDFVTLTNTKMFHADELFCLSVSKPRFMANLKHIL